MGTIIQSKVMDVADEKIRTEVLKQLYQVFEDRPRNGVSNEIIDESLPEISLNDINYMLRRLEDEHAEVQHYMSGKMDAQITDEGVEHLSQVGVSTFLDDGTRYDVLSLLYEADREGGGRGYVQYGDLVEKLGIDKAVLNRNLWYLEEKRLIESRGGTRGQYLRSAEITDHGRSKYEAYRDSGAEIPATSGSSFGRQASIDSGEQQQAENLFRDIVELARDEVLILDRFAREGLYELLEHVPNGVEIRVLTSGRVNGSDYTQTVREFQDDHPEIEVRKVDDSSWEFHDRYIFRDENVAWAWGHSFHDAGDTQHTASELAPINRDRTLSKFEETWEQGDQVS